MRLNEVGELLLIEDISRIFLTDDPRVIKGIGDDTAVTMQDGDRCLLATTDILEEDVHFSRSYSTPYLLGKKAVTISLSDIAAMGGRPTFLLISISLTDDIAIDYIRDIFRGVQKQVGEFGLTLIGGNTSSSKERIALATFMLGDAPMEEVVYRKGASVGDIIYVTGVVGDSALGLNILKSCSVKGRKIPEDGAVMKHLDPFPRIRAGRLLAERHLATAMIDISDGLLRDLRHLIEESGVGASVSISSLPLSGQLENHLLSNKSDIRLPLAGGEDYELLFTVRPSNVSRIDALSEELNLQITPIGTIVPKDKGLLLLDEEGRIVPIMDEGFEHFKSDISCYL